MTSAEFSSRYKLLKRITEQGVRSYNAQQAATGRVVMVHFLDGGQTEENQRLLSLLQRLDPLDKTKVLETADVDGTTVLVTEFLAGSRTLGEWLDHRARERRAESKADREVPLAASPKTTMPPMRPSPSMPPRPEPGEFTRMFQAGGGAVSPPPAPARTPTPPPAAPVGSFTDAFGAPLAAEDDIHTAPTKPIEVPVVPPPAPAPAPRAATAGAPAPVPASPPPAPAAPGEFTRMFQAQSASSPGSGASSAGGLPDAPVSPSFASPAPPAPPRSSPPPAPRGAAPSHADAPPAPAAPSAPESPRSPGEFTRIFQAQTPSFAPQPAAAPNAPPQAPSFREPRENTPFGGTPASPPPMRFGEAPGAPVLPQSDAPLGSVTDAFAAGGVRPASAPLPFAPAPFIPPAAPPPAPPPMAPAAAPLTGSASAAPISATGAFGFASPPAPAAPPAMPGPPAMPPLGGAPPAMSPHMVTPPMITPPPVTPARMGPPSVMPPITSAGASQGFAGGPSEFTRALGRVAFPPPPPAPAPLKPKVEEKPAAKPSYLPILIVLNVVFIAVVALVLYFALKR